MSASNKRYTQIDITALNSPRTSTLQEAEPQTSIDTSKRTISVASLKDRADTRREGVVYPNSAPQRSQLARPTSFPINVHEATKSGSPWLNFEASYGIRFGIDFRVTVAERKASPYDVVAIRSFPGAMDDTRVQMLRRVQHDNFVTVLDIFRSKESTHVVFEHAHVSLYEIARSRETLTKIELASILGQVVNGLAYLFIQRLEHGSLSSSNILVTMNGDVKIAAFEGYSTRESDETDSSDLKALGRIAMELMQDGKTEEGKVVGVTDLSHWDSDAASFLADTTSATSPDELKKHPLLKLPWKARHLKRQVVIAMLTVRMGLSLPL